MKQTNGEFRDLLRQCDGWVDNLTYEAFDTEQPYSTKMGAAIWDATYDITVDVVNRPEVIRPILAGPVRTAVSRHNGAVRIAVLALALALAAPAAARPLQDPPVAPPAPVAPPPSQALGKPYSHGRLVDGVQLPEFGEDHFTWDPVFNRIPNRPDAPLGHRPPGPHGADRDPRVPRRATTASSASGSWTLSRGTAALRPQLRRARPRVAPERARRRRALPAQGRARARARQAVTGRRQLSQDLVDRFVAAGAVKVFVGPHLHLHGPRRSSSRSLYHDDHMHVRIHNVPTGQAPQTPPAAPASR